MVIDVSYTFMKVSVVVLLFWIGEEAVLRYDKELFKKFKGSEKKFNKKPMLLISPNGVKNQLCTTFHGKQHQIGSH